MSEEYEPLDEVPEHIELLATWIKRGLHDVLQQREDWCLLEVFDEIPSEAYVKVAWSHEDDAYALWREHNPDRDVAELYPDGPELSASSG